MIMYYGLEFIEKKLRGILIDELTRTGLLFRLFSRVKTKQSIEEKLTRKSYSSDTKLMQDIIGFRITTYFCDDIQIIVDLCEQLFDVVELVYDTPTSEVFRPLRKNMICRMPEDDTKTLQELKPDNSHLSLIDNTFEIQFRTTLSEGWHEVEHLMRYKCKKDWDSLISESRMLNGIYATLETNDQALKALFDDISYQHYKDKRWEAMMRNKFRLNFSLKKLDATIVSYLNEKPNIGRKIFKLNRNEILNTYIASSLSLPISFDNWIYLINYCYLKDDFLTSITQPVLLDLFESTFNGDKSK